MPDTIVPVVRRPVVRRVKKSDDEAGKDATNTADRKLSLGVDSSKNQETAKLSLSSSPEKTSPTSTPSWKTPNSSTTSSTTPSWKTKAEPAVTPNWKTKTEPPTTPNWKTKAEPSTTPNWKTKQEPAQVEPKRKINKTPSGPAEPWMSYPVYPSLEKLDTFKHLETQTKPLKTQRDLALEHKVLQWIMSIIHEQPSTDYEHFIQDGSVLSKVITSIVFNSVPLEVCNDQWGTNFAQNRIKTVIREIRRYGVVDVFEVEDLIELKNIPKVTKCLAQLSKLVRHFFSFYKKYSSNVKMCIFQAASDKDSLLASNLDIPH